ncbi:hypothetical protein M8494_34790 [Serratia ureilytica]
MVHPLRAMARLENISQDEAPTPADAADAAPGRRARPAGANYSRNQQTLAKGACRHQAA